jgi:hypothetical protein
VTTRRPKSRRDGNHSELSNHFEALSCTVIDTHSVGIAGWPDLVVGCLGQNHLVEVKNPDTEYGRAGLSATQLIFNRDWRGAPMAVVSSVDEVTALVMIWRRNARR